MLQPRDQSLPPVLLSSMPASTALPAASDDVHVASPVVVGDGVAPGVATSPTGLGSRSSDDREAARLAR